MTEKQVVREVMKIRGWSQETLAQEAGFKSQSNITGLLNNNHNGIRIDNLLKMFNAMGCEIIIRDKMGSKKEWVIDGDEETLTVRKATSSISKADLDELLGEKK